MPRRKQGPVLAALATTTLTLTAAPGAEASLLQGLLTGTTPAPATATTTTANADGKTVSVVVTANPVSGDQVTSAAVPAPAQCAELPTTKAFQGVDGDPADYSLAPGGDFERGTAGWALTRGAKIVSGNERLGVTRGSKSLQMPIGSSALSPEFCVDKSHPHFRFAFKVDNAVLTGFLAHVVFRDATGRITGVELLSSTAVSLTPSAWQASPKSPLATIIPLSRASSSTTVQLKLTALSPADLANGTASAIIGRNPLVDIVTQTVGGGGNVVSTVTGLFGNRTNIGVTVDSVMVDPYRKR